MLLLWAIFAAYTKLLTPAAAFAFWGAAIWYVYVLDASYKTGLEMRSFCKDLTPLMIAQAAQHVKMRISKQHADLCRSIEMLASGLAHVESDALLPMDSTAAASLGTGNNLDLSSKNRPACIVENALACCVEAMPAGHTLLIDGHQGEFGASAERKLEVRSQRSIHEKLLS